LGYDYFIEGKVIEGDKLGRTIGYPTANLQLHNEEKLVPGDGVYAVEIIWNKQPLQGMLYIGSRPVVNGKRRVIEVNIFNFNETIYQENLKIIFQSYIRADINMSNFEELKRQLDVDKTSALTFFKNSK
ncbi:MAG TPA: riboflavin kinase, partial [Chitinophagaceae bacterium]|nr:riboflavin kinase [Chitinophagaceae bacterium]